MKWWIGKIVLCMLAASLLSCGGSRPIAREAVPLGLVPFVSENLAPEAESVNQQLVKVLHSSGSFRIQLVAPEPALWSLQDFSTRADSALRWLVTGRILLEKEETTPGLRLPYLFYQPKTGIHVQLEYRLYDATSKGWKAIGRLDVVTERKGPVQLLAYEPNDPALALSATERAVLRQEAYRRLFARLAETLEKELEVQR